MNVRVRRHRGKGLWTVFVVKFSEFVCGLAAGDMLNLAAGVTGPVLRR